MTDVAPEVQDQPTDQPEAPVEDQPTTDQQESFTDFDASQIPDDADREWLAERYQQMQADYTRKTMGLGEARREAEQATQIINALRQPNPQIRAATLAQLGITERDALEMFGYQVPEEEEENELGLDEVRDPRVDSLLQERAKEKADAELLDTFAGHVEALEKTAKRELSPAEQKALWRNVQGDLATNGTANVQEIWAEMKGLYSEREKALLGPKRNTPRPPGGGKPGSRTVDPSKETKEERLERMANAVEQARASGQ